MYRIHLTVHYANGYTESAELAEGEYTMGSGESAQIPLRGESIASEHVLLLVAIERLEIEPLAPGVNVNGYAIEERVAAEFPVSIEFPEITVLLEIRQGAATPPEEKPAPGTPDPDATVPPPPGSARPRKRVEVTLTPAASPEEASQRPARDDSVECEAPLQGAYKLGREIARGGMGKIYAGEDPDLKREVAVKVSSLSAGGADPRFSKEAEVLAQLAHPNIVPIYAIGVDTHTRPYYAMKLVKGQTLQAILNALRAGEPAAVREYPPAALLTIFRKVCDAMAFAHSKCILHRDLKPENIMVGEYGEVLVMDWGLAKMLGRSELSSMRSHGSIGSTMDAASAGMTLEGDVMGTPQYMSPEQAEGMVAELDERSDIYSLGGILYALLTLRPPVEGESVQEVLTKVRNGQISSMISQGSRKKVEVGTPVAMDRRVPDALQAVTRKAMSRDRAQRYGSVEELAADIEAYQSGFATRAEQAGTVKQIALFIKRHKAFSSMVAVFLLAAAAFMWKLTLSEKRALENERTSHLSAAAAQVALAEAAEETADSERMRDALAKVPPELRDANWEYLDKRSDYADLEIHPPNKIPWKALLDSPGDPDGFVALQANGQVSRIDALTADITPLWKAERAGFTLQPNSTVSPDSKRIALFYQKGSNLKEMQIHELQSGSLLSTIPMVPANESRTVSSVVLTQNTFVARSNKNEIPTESLVEAWDAASGQKLWDMPQIRFIQSGTSSQSIMALTPEGKTFLVDADTGRTLGDDYSFFENRFIPSTDQCAFLGNGTTVFNTSGNIVRKLDGKNVSLIWLVPCSFTSPLAIRVSPSGYQFAVLGRRSMFGSVLEIRTADGFLLKSAPFQNKAGISRIARSRDCFAIATVDRILVWNLRRSPVLQGIAVDNNYSAGYAPAAGGTRIASATHTLQDGHQLSLWKPEPNRTKSQKTASAAIEGLVEKRGPTLLANPEGTHFLLALDDRAATARVENGQIETVLKGQKLPVAFPATGCAVALHPTGDRFLLGGKIFDFVTGRELASLKRPFVVLSRVTAQRYSGAWVGSDHVVQIASFRAEEEEESDEKRILVLSNVLTGDIEAKVSAPTVASLAASPDGKWIAEGGTDKRLRIRNGKTLEVERDLRAHDASVAALAWHPTRPLLASAERGRIRIWNTQTWRILEQLDVPPEEAILDISADGKHVLLHRKTVDFYEPKSFRE